MGGGSASEWNYVNARAFAVYPGSGVGYYGRLTTSVYGLYLGVANKDHEVGIWAGKDSSVRIYPALEITDGDTLYGTGVFTPDYENKVFTISTKGNCDLKLNPATDLVDVNGEIRTDTQLTIKERASAPDHLAAHGMLWVKNTDPTELWFTDDTGTDTKIV